MLDIARKIYKDSIDACVRLTDEYAGIAQRKT